MPVSIEELRTHLQAFDFPRLFVEGLGWDHFIKAPFVVASPRAMDYEYALKPVAEKAQFAVLRMRLRGPMATMSPITRVRRKDRDARLQNGPLSTSSSSVDAARNATGLAVGQKRQPGKPTACREHRRSMPAQTGQPLCCSALITSLFVALEDEAKSLNIGIGDVTASIGLKALDVEKVTKRFYDRFQQELKDLPELRPGYHRDRREHRQARLVRFPHAQPHDVRLLHPEAALPGRQPRLPP